MLAPLLTLLCLAAPPAAAETPAAGLDHVPIAVADLDAAAARFRALGFTLKPGRSHDNGLRNVHAKFPDGTELELITAPESRDDLTRHYRAFVSSGGAGPAFASFHAPALADIPGRLGATGSALRGSAKSGMLTFPRDHALGYFFFGSRNASPTDRPEHFQHANGAASLCALWLAADDLSAEISLLTALGARDVGTRHVPAVGITARVFVLREGAEVLLLPGSVQRVRGRRIVGATLRVPDLAAARNLWTAAGIPFQEAPSALFAPPESANGLWLELRAGGSYLFQNK